MPTPKKMPIAGTVMTSFPYFVEADDDMGKIEKMMDEHNIRHLPVQDKGTLVGIVSERDLHHLIKRTASAEEKAKLRARDFMIDEPYTVAFRTPLSEVVAEMAKRHIGSVLVTRGGKLAGIISAMDICRIFGEYLDAMFPHGGGHEAA